MTQLSDFESMVAGDWYGVGPELVRMTTDTHAACRRITALFDSDQEAAVQLFEATLGSVGEGVGFRPPLYLDYGSQLHVGAGSFLNADFLALGGGEIRIGERVLIGPSARLYTPTHPLDVETRRSGLERVLPITIGDDVWIGGSVVICPGVTIGPGSVIAAGAVVTENVPAGVLVGGNPARIIRTLEDK